MSGEVWLDIVVNERGETGDITVVSPLGYGLDEQAASAIATWKFRPGTRSGVPVKVRATVRVVFYFRPGTFDRKAEAQRGRFNAALFNLKSGDPKRKANAIKVFEALASEKHAPGMYAYALFLRSGDGVAKDEAVAADLIRRAADKNYGPAMYEIGQQYLHGSGGLPLDASKGHDLIVSAANLGSDAAQFFIGAASEAGMEGWERNEDGARQFFRLCAAGGRADCQYRLARLILNRSGRRESDFTQAIAWLQLAEAGGSKEAGPLLKSYTGTLTSKQRDAVNEWKPKLTRKN